VANGGGLQLNAGDMLTVTGNASVAEASLALGSTLTVTGNAGFNNDTSSLTLSGTLTVGGNLYFGDAGPYTINGGTLTAGSLSTDGSRNISVTGGAEFLVIGNDTTPLRARIRLPKTDGLPLVELKVGPEWQVAGLGDFNCADTSDMILRDGNTGAFEVYDISNNTITSAASLAVTYPIGTVALQWAVAGFGDFSGNADETDMLMRAISGPAHSSTTICRLDHGQPAGSCARDPAR